MQNTIFINPKCRKTQHENAIFHTIDDLEMCVQVQVDFSISVPKWNREEGIDVLLLHERTRDPARKGNKGETKTG